MQSTHGQIDHCTQLFLMYLSLPLEIMTPIGVVHSWPPQTLPNSPALPICEIGLPRCMFNDFSSRWRLFKQRKPYDLLRKPIGWQVSKGHSKTSDKSQPWPRNSFSKLSVRYGSHKFFGSADWCIYVAGIQGNATVTSLAKPSRIRYVRWSLVDR